MKILYIAFACNPYAGSEAQCGWAWPYTMSKNADVSIITRSENEPFIEKYLSQYSINNINIIYHDINPKFNLYKMTGKFYHTYYLLWNISLKQKLRKLLKENIYDYVHQVTLGDFRYINGASCFTDNYIVGPVGGGQLTPRELRSYIKNDRLTEMIRRFINNVVINSFVYKKRLNSCRLVLSANKETKLLVDSIINDQEKSMLLTENGVYLEKLIETNSKKDGEKCIILWAGRMVTRKGIEFLLDIVPYLKTKKDYEIRLVGEGNQKEKLEKHAIELGINDRVSFVGKVSYDEMKANYEMADIFVFPSLRETTGSVIFEAMSNSLPVVIFDQNGASEIVNDENGSKIKLNQSIENIKLEFAEALDRLIEDGDLRQKKGKNAYLTMKNFYTWETKCEFFYRYLLQLTTK